MKKFSILMSVYYKENPDYLAESFQSLHDQTVPSDEIIVVQDGALTDELYAVINHWKGLLPVRVLGLDENRGLGIALQAGLEMCSHELVARMDADDVAVPERFEKQLQAFERDDNLVLLGSHVFEFMESINEVLYKKHVPMSQEDIYRYARWRNPFNHMTVMYKKSAVLDAGGYRHSPGFEDYDLWTRLIKKNYSMENLNEYLVFARIGNDMVGRRTGLDYLKKEHRFLNDLYYHRGFINFFEYMFNILIRLPLRMAPKLLLKIVYTFLRKMTTYED